MKEFTAPKKWHFVVLVAMIVCAVFVYFRSKDWPTVTMYFGATRLEVLVADTYQRQFQGLSGRESLGEYDGMLFPFGVGGTHPMVMRDMLFSIDLIWLDGTTVVDITTNAPLQKGAKEADLRRYESKSISTSVLEIPAGSATKWGIKVGDTFVLAD